MEGIKNWMGT